MPSKITDNLSDDLYEKTRAELKTFLDETDTLLATGDVLHQDRTQLARERLAAFLEHVTDAADGYELPPPRANRTLAEATAYVKRHPWAAVGVATGLGLIVSLLVRRNRA